ncbi:hypothetical protein PPL_11414 [Heterostelium album PN500]|uniref:Ankyrin repeat-containing protein n=1 Tax=Heterostelium pallidum (strain ATCC 26659 / Pp 5 / PN500) TaxID=670386 RepID=D3BTC1_HETP5|nr:hypothetical protein PPL_11414 [Heterostelium album PN500]EFA75338.1 hypothetical protein PPL_11414 [Heterostelium album PN500]|eukprot:XP_020427472.1 hypothetical protein PPL_11414 [Heterostelium album PN500]
MFLLVIFRKLNLIVACCKMEKEIFLKIFNNVVLSRLIFDNVRYIHTACLKTKKVYRWEEVLSLPYVMVGNNYFQMFKNYFYKNKVETLLQNFNAIIINATRTGNLEILRYVIDEIQFEIMIRCNRSLQLDMLASAALNGYLHIVKYYQSKTKFRFDCELALKMAIEGGHIQLLEYLVGVAKQIESSSSSSSSSSVVISDHRIIDHAAKCNRFDIVRYLHSANVGTASNKAMDYAALNNNIQMLMWLHHNRAEGCTSDSYYHAIENNNLEMLKWLYENTSKGQQMAPNALRKAEAKGNLELIQWLKAIERKHLYSQRCKEIQNQTNTNLSTSIKM